MSKRRRRQRPTRLKVKHPSDFIAAVPFMLGFHPHESLVCLFLHDGRTQFAMRIDLPPVAAAPHLAEQVLRLAERNGASEVLVIGYSADPEAARPLLGALIRLLGRLGPLDVLLVGPDRWWSLLCLSGCCPSDGTAYDLSSHPVAVQAVYAGLTASPDRSSLAARVAGPPAAEEERLGRVADDLAAQVLDRPRAQRMAEMTDLVRRYLDDPWALTDDDCARLALLCTDLVVRDVAWSMLTRRDADSHIALWQQVVARTVAPLEAAPLCLLAMAGWVGGHGSLLNCCIERMELVAPDYSMLEILLDISERAIPPSLWDSMAGSMAEEIRAMAG